MRRWPFRTDTESSQTCFAFISLQKNAWSPCLCKGLTDWLIRGVVINEEWFSSINRDITHSHYLWPESQTSRCTICAAASQTLCLCLYNSILTSLLKTFLTRLHQDTPVCRSIRAEPGRWCTDHCKEAGRIQRHMRKESGLTCHSSTRNDKLNGNLILCFLWDTVHQHLGCIHTCLSSGNPCPAGCSLVCCQGWRQRSDTWLWLGWWTPTALPVWQRA